MNKLINICNSIGCFFGLHKWKLGRLLEFSSAKMDSYGKRSHQIQIRDCDNCQKTTGKAI